MATVIGREPDSALIERARGGDVDALVRAYTADVYRTAYRVLGDAELAADATQDAFVNAIAALDRFRGDASLRTWLLRIAVNAAKSIGRRRSRRREVAIAAAGATPSRDRPVDEAAVDRTESDRARRALARLPEKQRLCVSLRVEEDLSYAEIGEIVGCSETAARVNYHYGLQRLREVLGDHDAM